MAKRFKTSSRRFRRIIRKRFRRNVRRIAFGIAEKKYYDYWINPVNNVVYTSYTGAVATQLSQTWTGASIVCTIPQGFSQGERIGNKIFLKYIQMSMYFAADPDEVDMVVNGTVCRYMVLMNKNCGKVAASASDVFSSDATAGKASYGALRNFNTLSKYKVMLDRQHTMTVTSINAADATANATTGAACVIHYIPVNKLFTFDSAVTSRTSANCPLTDIQLFACANVDTCCALKIKLRLCYTDA